MLPEAAETSPSPAARSAAGNEAENRIENARNTATKPRMPVLGDFEYEKMFRKLGFIELG